MEKKTEIVRLNREYRGLCGHDYFIRTEPSGKTGTRWVFGDVSVYSLDAALTAMLEGLETARQAVVR
jgi:hypothetical protein